MRGLHPDPIHESGVDVHMVAQHAGSSLRAGQRFYWEGLPTVTAAIITAAEIINIVLRMPVLRIWSSSNEPAGTEAQIGLFWPFRQGLPPRRQ
jgi:hypothetical protein